MTMTKQDAIAKYHSMEQRIEVLEAELEERDTWIRDEQQRVSDDNTLPRRIYGLALRTSHAVRRLRIRSPFTSV